MWCRFNDTGKSSDTASTDSVGGSRQREVASWPDCSTWLTFS